MTDNHLLEAAEALRPFAAFIERIDALPHCTKRIPAKPADDRVVHVSIGMDFATDFTVATFRRAAATLAKLERTNA